MRAFLLCCILWVTNAAFADQTIRGIATVVDGDTIHIGAESVRLAGIDAPEQHQYCGKHAYKRWACGYAATQRLRTLAHNQEVHCAHKSRDRYGRIIGTCFVGTLNLNQQMVESGLALAYRRYSTRYVIQETRAKTQQIGLWQSNFTPPWQWRRQKYMAY